MDKSKLLAAAAEIYSSLPGNILTPDMDIPSEYAGIRLYDEPILGFGSAADPLFDTFKNPGVIGPWHMSPEEWLPGAKSVVSLFFPMSEAVRLSNREETDRASLLWAVARIEGQAYILRFMAALAEILRDAGCGVCVPAADPRWQSVAAGKGIEGYPEITPATFGSRWSERHAAYVCALGTFGLSRGLITRRGMAGRFGSLITDLPLPPDERGYTGVSDDCTLCLACARRCPVGAIDREKGKDHLKCAAFVEHSKQVLAPRYGCGLCQTKVPCEYRRPSR